MAAAHTENHRHTPQAFTLDRTSAHEWLNQMIIATEVADLIDPTDVPAISIGMCWRAHQIGSEDSLLQLIHQVQRDQILNGPIGASIELEFVDDGDDGFYRFVLNMTTPKPLTLVSPAQELQRLGNPDAIGADAALAVLEEATQAANALLDQLATFVQAFPRVPGP